MILTIFTRHIYRFYLLMMSCNSFWMTTPPAVSLKAKSTLSSLASQKVQGFNNHEFLITTSHGYIFCIKRCVSDFTEMILLSSYGAISRENAHFTTFLFKTHVFSSISLHISSSKKFLENLRHTFVPTSLLDMLTKKLRYFDKFPVPFGSICTYRYQWNFVSRDIRTD